MTTASAEHQLLEEFIAALEAEHAALVERRTEDLPELAARKADCGRRLERTAKPEFRKAMQAAQQRRRAGLPAAYPLHTELYEMLRRAAELNRINGALIQQNLSQVRLSLARIEPRHPARQLYGRDGQGRRSLVGRSFGSA